MLLRREVVQTIVWAGNPDKSMMFDETTGVLNPRASFAAWEETVRDCSRPWTELELENARLLREQFINARLERDLREREVQYQQERARSTLFQRAVLPPRLPTVAGLTFDAVYEHLGETARRLGPTAVAHPAATIRRLVIPNGSPDDVAILVVRTNFDESERDMTRSHFDSADAFAARAARRSFFEALPSTNLSDADKANAEIVFGELCGNVARYAPGRVDVVLDCSGVQAVLHILDRGSGFRHLSRLPTDVFSEAGRGLFIIASMTTEFTVAPRSGGGSHARAVLVGRYPISLLLDETLPAIIDQIAAL